MANPIIKTKNLKDVIDLRDPVGILSETFSRGCRDLFHAHAITAKIHLITAHTSSFDKDFIHKINGHGDAFGTT